MVRNYKRKSDKRFQYEKENLLNAVSLVKQGTKLSTAAKQCNVPRNTLRRHVNCETVKVGGKTILTKNQEDILTERVLYMAKRGFPLNIAHFLKVAYSYAETLSRRGELQNKIPDSWNLKMCASQDYWLSFKKRNPRLVLRKPEGLSAARAQGFNKTRVEEFFENLRSIYTECDLENFPQLIYNADETGLSTVPNKPNRVIAEKGDRTVQAIQVGERGVLTTILPCANAAGDYIPPFIIVKCMNIPSDLRQIYEKQKICVAATKSGYVDSDAFLKFLEHFNAHRIKVPGKKCILIIDGHSSHLSVGAIEFTIANDIELVCLPPHTTNRLQPFDTHFNGPLKKAWTRALENFLNQEALMAISRTNFANLFIEVYSSMDKRGLIVDGFQYCGLYPLNNPIKDEEYEKSKSFQNLEGAEVHQSSMSSSTAVALRKILKSPKKMANMVHIKPHNPRISTDDVLKSKAKNPKRLKVKLNCTKSTASSKTNESSPTKPNACRPKPIIQSAGRGESSSSATIIGSVQNQCNVCQAIWESATEDWFLCGQCGRWSCESCFGSTMCYFCE